MTVAQKCYLRIMYIMLNIDSTMLLTYDKIPNPNYV